MRFIVWFLERYPLPSTVKVDCYACGTATALVKVHRRPADLRPGSADCDVNAFAHSPYGFFCPDCTKKRDEAA